MAVTYVPYQGEEVSREIYAVIMAYEADTGRALSINEGHRTWARQAYFYALYKAGKGALAARPSHDAPHILTGRANHAIDADSHQWDHFSAWCRRVGLIISRPVEDEAWLWVFE